MTEVRRAISTDAADIARVHYQSHAEAYRPLFGAGYVAPGEVERAEHWQKRLDRGETLYVALADDEIIGFTHAEVGADGRAIMTTLYLLATYHRRGIGRNLMTWILRDLAASGHNEAYIDCLAANAKATAFYTSQGAREIGRHGSGLCEEIRFVIPTSAARPPRVVRQALPADAAAIARVTSQTHAYRPLFGIGYVPNGEAECTSHWLKRLERGDPLYVAVVDSEIVGFVHAQIESDGRAVMTALYLWRDFYRQFMGEELMAVLLNHLHASGHTEITFECRPEDYGAFIRALGAREIGRHGAAYYEVVRLAIATRPPRASGR